MKVVEICYNWPAETFIQRHIESLVSTGFPVQLVARHALDLFAENASTADENPPIPVEIMPNFNHLGKAGKLWSLRYLIGQGMRAGQDKSLGEQVLLGYFERLKPDIIHFHDASLATSMRWMPEALGVPYTLSLRGSDIQTLPNRSDAQKKEIVSALKGARKIHAVCDHLGHLAKELAGSPLDVQTIYTTVPLPGELARWVGAENRNELHIVSSGRVVWRKGFPYLLLALRSLLDRGEKARLTIIGTGPDLDSILYMRKTLGLETHLTLAGKMSYQEMMGLLGCAHIYVQSSVVEGLSNALAEAMANGVPVFATDVGGTREIIEDGVTGFLLPPFQPEKWADIFVNAKDCDLMEQVRSAAYQKSRECFSSGHHARAFADFFTGAM